MVDSSTQATLPVGRSVTLTAARVLARLGAFCADTLLFVMTFIVLMSVFYRYALGDPIFWVEEVSRFLFAYIVFLGAALSTHRRGHMAVDVLVKKLPHRVKDGWHVAIDMVVATVLLFVLVEGWRFTLLSQVLISTALHIPMSVFFFSVPLGAALMRPYIEEMARVADVFVSCYPNAGLPNPMAEP
jgi:TRAP-type C4-dicarboxylate transport system permease small subunit